MPTLSKKRGARPCNACKITEDPQRQRGVGGGGCAWGWTGRFLYEKRAILIHELRHSGQILWFPPFKPPPGGPGDLPGGPWVAIGPRKYSTSRGPGRNRTQETRHFGGAGPQPDRENTSLPGVRDTIGTRKHVTSRGPDRSRTEQTCHSEGPGSQSGRENTSLRGVGPQSDR